MEYYFINNTAFHLINTKMTINNLFNKLWLKKGLKNQLKHNNLIIYYFLKFQHNILYC